MMRKKKRMTFFYGWLIAIICFFMITIAYGTRYSFPVFYIYILREFGWSRADTALILSLNIIVYGLAAPFIGMAMDRVGPRKLMTAGTILLAISMATCSLTSQIWHFFVLFGFLVPLGTCAIGIVPNTALLSRWFVRQRGKAFGFIQLGFGAAFAIAYVINHMITQIGWRMSFVALGLIVFLLIPFINLFLRFDPREKGILPDDEFQKTSPAQANQMAGEASVLNKMRVNQEWNLVKAMKTYRLWLLFLTHLLLGGIASHLTTAHQVAYAVDMGYSLAFGALVFSLYGILLGFGGSMGFLADRIGREITFSIGTTLAILGVAMLILNRGNHTPELMYAYGVLFGTGIGIASPAFIASVADLYGGKSFGSIMGVITVALGIGGSIGPWLGGKIFDLLGTYVPAFYVAIIALVISLLCLWIAGPRQVRLVPGKVHKTRV